MVSLLSEQLESNIPGKRGPDKWFEAELSWHITITLKKPVRIDWESEDIEAGTEPERGQMVQTI